MSEKDMLQQAILELKEGSEHGFNTIYAQTYNYVFQRACFFMKNEEEALDVVQDVYVAVYKSIHTLEDSSKLYAWMGGITYNLAMKAFRKKKEILLDEDKESIFENIELDDISLKPEEKTQADATAQIIKEILEELPELQRAAVFAFYFDNMSVKEIAEQFECSENTIKSRLNYARKYLKDAVLEREKKEGYRLHSFGIPTLLLALYLYGKENRLTKTAAQTTYNKVCATVGVEPGNIVSANVGNAITDEIYQAKLQEMTNSSMVTGSSSAATAGAEIAGAVKTGGLALGAKVAIGVAAVTAVIGTMAGVAHFQSPQKAEQPVLEESVDSADTEQEEAEADITYPIDITNDLSEEDREILEAVGKSIVRSGGLAGKGSLIDDARKFVAFDAMAEEAEYKDLDGLENAGFLTESAGSYLISEENYVKLMDYLWNETSESKSREVFVKNMTFYGRQMREDGTYEFGSFLAPIPPMSVKEFQVIQTSESFYQLRIKGEMVSAYDGSLWTSFATVDLINKENSPFAGMSITEVYISQEGYKGEEEETEQAEESENSLITNADLVNGAEASYTIETVTVEHPNGTFEYPQIQGWANEEKQAYWNDIFTLKEITEEDLEQTYEVKTANENYLSIMIKGAFQGGLHPYSFKTIYNIDMRTGEVIKLADCADIMQCAALLADDNSYISENPEVDMSYIMEFNNMYYDVNAAYEQQIQSVLQETIIDHEETEGVKVSSWYIKDGQLSIVFYVAHAYGDFVDFTIVTP